MKQIKDKVKCERAIEKLELEKEIWYTESGISDISVGKRGIAVSIVQFRWQVADCYRRDGKYLSYTERWSKYFIAMNEGIYLLGDMEFMNPAPCIYFVEAVTPVTVAVLSLKKYRNVLKQDVKFMNLIASTLAAKLGIAANGESG